MGQDIYTTPGTHNWTCPAATTSVTVECWGGGGGGAGASNGTGGGGGGGGYAKEVVTVVPGNTYSLFVGGGGGGGVPGGPGFGGGSSTFASTVTAQGGSGGSSATTGNGAGGAGGTANTGTTTFDGGSGGNGSFPDVRGGGGGGGAGSAANGNNAIAWSIGSGGSPDGGNGGIGGSGGGGYPGQLLGGGGSGAALAASAAGGDGARGQVTITCSSCGGSGDPHFVGFDDERFDFHGKAGSRYLLYKDDLVTVNSLFIEAEGETYLGEIEIIHDGKKRLFTLEGWDLQRCGHNDTLPGSLCFVAGQIIGREVVKLPHGNIVVSLTESGLIRHLNILFNVYSSHATGIIGQTKTSKRVPNESFEL